MILEFESMRKVPTKSDTKEPILLDAISNTVEPETNPTRSKEIDDKPQEILPGQKLPGLPAEEQQPPEMSTAQLRTEEEFRDEFLSDSPTSVPMEVNHDTEPIENVSKTFEESTHTVVEEKIPGQVMQDISLVAASEVEEKTKSTEASSGFYKMPKFDRIKLCVLRGDVAPIMEPKPMVCFCKNTQQELQNGLGCAADDCLNRALFMECGNR